MKDLETVLSNAYRLKGTPFGINRQFPEEIKQARRSLYPILKEKRNQGCRVKLVRDVLYVDGVVYEDQPSDDSMYTRPKTHGDATRSTPDTRNSKRRRISSTPSRY